MKNRFVIIIFLYIHPIICAGQNCLILLETDLPKFEFGDSTLEKSYTEKMRGDTLSNNISLLIINGQRNNYIRYLTITPQMEYSLVYIINGIEKVNKKGFLGQTQFAKKETFLDGDFYTVCPINEASISFNYAQINYGNKIFTIKSTDRDIREILSNHKEIFELHVSLIDLFDSIKNK